MNKTRGWGFIHLIILIKKQKARAYLPSFFVPDFVLYKFMVYKAHHTITILATPLIANPFIRSFFFLCPLFFCVEREIRWFSKQILDFIIKYINLFKYLTLGASHSWWWLGTRGLRLSHLFSYLKNDKIPRVQGIHHKNVVLSRFYFLSVTVYFHSGPV